MSAAIMPCPHCGEGPTLSMEEGESSVYCGKCQTGGPICESASTAIRAWNRLSLATGVAEAAWLGRETTSAAHLCRWSSIIVRPGPALDPASSGLAQKLGELLDAWGEDGQGDAS